MATKAPTALATVDVGNYPVLSVAENADAMEIMQENLGGQSLSISDLDRVKVPSGDSPFFSVPGMEEATPEKTITGIIVLAPSQRAYWKSAMDDNPGSAPDCFSPDGKMGIGDPGGYCAVCPNAKWGSKDNGGQLCREMRPLFVLREDAMMPLVIQVPPTSLANVKKYFVRLAGAGVPYYGAVTTIGLNKTQNKAGISFFELTLALAGRLSKEDTAKAKAYCEMMKPLVSKAPIVDGPTIPANPTSADVFGDEAYVPKEESGDTPFDSEPTGDPSEYHGEPCGG